MVLSWTTQPDESQQGLSGTGPKIAASRCCET